MSEVQIPWAPGATFLHVVCRLGEPRPDALDLDQHPDLMTQTGQVILKCSAPRIKYLEEDGRWRMLSMREWKFSVRPSDGELFLPESGIVGVDILSGLSRGVDPALFTWSASVKPAVGANWKVIIPGDLQGTVDLVALAASIGVPASVGVSLPYVRSVNGVAPDVNGNVVLVGASAPVEPTPVDPTPVYSSDGSGGAVLDSTAITQTPDGSGGVAISSSTATLVPDGSGGVTIS